MADVNSSITELDSTFICSLNAQYINVFHRSIPHYMTIVLCIVVTAVVVIAVLMNFLVVASVIATPKLQTPTFLLLCNLALTDLIIGLLIGSTEVSYLITRALGQYDVFCYTWKILVILSYILCPASLYTITAISYDRYLSLLMKNKYKTVVTKKKVCICIALLWVWSGLGVTLISVLGKTSFLILVCCVSFFCLIVIIDCYVLSFTAITQHQREISSSMSHYMRNPKFQSTSRKSFVRHDEPRKSVKRRIESFGLDNEERKRIAKSCDIEERDGMCQYGSRGFYDENADDVIEQASAEEEEENIYNEELGGLVSENDEAEANEIQNKDLQNYSVRKVRKDFGKCKRMNPSTIQMSQLDSWNLRSTFDPTKTKYLLVKKDIEIEMEVEEDSVRMTAREDEGNKFQAPNDTSSQSLQYENKQRDTVNSKLTIHKASLLIDVKKFKKTLRTILIIVVALFICYLPYMIVSTLVTLSVLDIGIAWDLAAITVYVNSAISPVVMCTRIANIRAACRRIMKRMSCQH